MQQSPPPDRRAPSTPRVPWTRTSSNGARLASREPPAQVVANPLPAPPTAATSTAPSNPPSGSVPIRPDVAIEPEQSAPVDEDAARLQLTVEIAGKTTTAHARLTDWQWVTSLGLTGLTGEAAVERIVVTAVQRALSLPPVSSRRIRVEPVRLGSRVPDCSVPDSWEGLAAFTQSGGTFRATGRLQGGRDPSGSEPARATMHTSLAASPPLIEQVKGLAHPPAQRYRRAPPPPLPTPNAQT